MGNNKNQENSDSTTKFGIKMSEKMCKYAIRFSSKIQSKPCGVFFSRLAVIFASKGAKAFAENNYNSKKINKECFNFKNNTQYKPSNKKKL